MMQGPATERQLKALRNLRVEITKEIRASKQEASDAIVEALEERKQMAFRRASRNSVCPNGMFDEADDISFFEDGFGGGLG